jgi:hypothetical protein
VVVTQVCGRSGDQGSKGVDEFASLVQIGRVPILAKPTLNGGGAHEVNGSGGNQLNSRNLCNVSHCLIEL